MRSEPRFDELIHPTTRLRVCAALRRVQAADFGALTSMLGLSDATLSKTIRSLADVGYVLTSKQPSPNRQDARRTTTVALTAAGRRAFDGHIAAIQLLSDVSHDPHSS